MLKMLDVRDYFLSKVDRLNNLDELKILSKKVDKFYAIINKAIHYEISDDEAQQAEKCLR